MKVSEETQAYCTSCREMREHIIVAMVGPKPAKVECLSCHKQHLYRAAPPGTPTPRAAGATTRTPKAKAAAPAPAPAFDLGARIAGRTARAYSPDATFAVDEVVRHPNFGTGLVLALPAKQKVEIAFPSGSKLLMHDRKNARPSTLEHPPVREDDGGQRNPTDAPPRSRH
jgi:hypothetical protein